MGGQVANYVPTKLFHEGVMIMEIKFDKKQYDIYFQEFKRKNRNLPPIVGYTIEKFDTLKIFFEQGDNMLYDINTGQTIYIPTKMKKTEKRKVGRPSCFGGRNESVKIRVTRLEKDRLQALSDYYEKPSSDILRDLINDKYSEVYKK